MKWFSSICSHYRDGSMDYGNGGISEVSLFCAIFGILVVVYGFFVYNSSDYRRQERM